MNPTICWLCTVLVWGLVQVSLAAEAGPTPDEIQKITAAVPDRPRVAPRQPRKVLVFSLSWGYKHDSIPYGRKAIEILARKTGAFEAVLSDDPSMFEPDRLGTFDAVVFNNTNNEIFLPEDFEKLNGVAREQVARRDQQLKASFVRWLSGGKGLVVLHAGVASFRQWPEFGDIIGARFDNHPWSGTPVTLKVDEPGHSLARAFAEPRFVVVDEIYQMKAPYSRERLRVLLSIDTGKTDMTRPGIHRTDGDFAMTWIKAYGQGRVFYNALGHEHAIFWNPVVLQHWLDGIQYATGDLPADATPKPAAGR